MVRYLVVAASAFALMSGVALAETTTTVTRSSPTYVAPQKTTVVKKRVNRYGQVVAVKKTYRGGYSGSSTVSRTKTTTNPYTGTTSRTKTTVHGY